MLVCLRAPLVLAAIMLAAPVAASDVITIRRDPVAITPADRATMTDPALRLAGAWQLQSDDKRLGGLSAMSWRDGALRILSDSGVMLHWSEARDTAEAIADTLRLPAPCGKPRGKKAGDSESLAFAPDGNGLRIGLERANLICAMQLDGSNARVSAVPAMARWPRNKGAEAMASLPDKGMAIIGESADAKDGTRPFLWFAGDASNIETPLVTMRYAPPKGFKPGEAAFLPDGRMLILNRYHGIGGRYASVLTLLPAFDPQPGLILEGQEIARIENTSIAANYEGMAVEPRDGGATIWMVTDNNFAPDTRTLLLRLEWDERTLADSSLGTAQSGN